MRLKGIFIERTLQRWTSPWEDSVVASFENVSPFGAIPMGPGELGAQQREDWR
jgi:hypothetical protein